MAREESCKINIYFARVSVYYTVNTINKVLKTFDFVKWPTFSRIVIVKKNVPGVLGYIDILHLQ